MLENQKLRVLLKSIENNLYFNTIQVVPKFFKWYIFIPHFTYSKTFKSINISFDKN